MKPNFNQKSIILWFIVVLLVANITALLTIYVKIGPNQVEIDSSRNGIRHIQGRHGDQLPTHHFLHFSEEQQTQLDLLRNKQLMHKWKTMDAMDKLKMHIIRELVTDNPDSIKLNNYAREFGILQEEIKKSGFHHFLEIKHLCDEDQKELFNEMMQQIMNEPAPGPGFGLGRQKRKHRMFNQ